MTEDYFYRGGKKIPLRRVSAESVAAALGRASESGEAYVQVGRDPACALIPTGEIVARFAPEVSRAKIELELAARGARIERALEYLPNGYLVRAPGGEGRALRLANELHDLPFVIAAEPNWIRRTTRR